MPYISERSSSSGAWGVHCGDFHVILLRSGDVRIQVKDEAISLDFESFRALLGRIDAQARNQEVCNQE